MGLGWGKKQFGWSGCPGRRWASKVGGTATSWEGLEPAPSTNLASTGLRGEPQVQGAAGAVHAQDIEPVAWLGMPVVGVVLGWSGPSSLALASTVSLLARVPLLAPCRRSWSCKSCSFGHPWLAHRCRNLGALRHGFHGWSKIQDQTPPSGGLIWQTISELPNGCSQAKLNSPSTRRLLELQARGQPLSSCRHLHAPWQPLLASTGSGDKGQWENGYCRLRLNPALNPGAPSGSAWSLDGSSGLRAWGLGFRN